MVDKLVLGDLVHHITKKNIVVVLSKCHFRSVFLSVKAFSFRMTHRTMELKYQIIFNFDLKSLDV